MTDCGCSRRAAKMLDFAERHRLPVPQRTRQFLERKAAEVPRTSVRELKARKLRR